MGTVGPTQFIVFVNGRIRSFTKAGVADGVLNADPDVFFASVSDAGGAAGGARLHQRSADPLRPLHRPLVHVHHRRAVHQRHLHDDGRQPLDGRGERRGEQRHDHRQHGLDLLRVPDRREHDFCDYPSLGIDVNALYVGCNIFSGAGTFVGTNGYVIQKASILGAGPIVVTMFANLAAGAGAGPESPRGVDNFDPGATEGYFVGPDNAAFSTIQFRRVSNPGSLTPTISANIPVTVPTTTISPANYIGCRPLWETPAGTTAASTPSTIASSRR